MEQDALKSAWQDMVTEPQNNNHLKSMMRETTHPVLKRMRKQLIIETIAFTIFLFVYYDFFDGNRKPLYANVLLVAAMLLVILHNIITYLLTRGRNKGNTIKQSLEAYLVKMKVHAAVSVVSRVLMAGCLLLFFTSVIAFNSNKYWILAAIILVFVIQIALLARIWRNRIRGMKRTINLFLI